MSLKTQTAESVAQGHPDKVCDQLADAILDAYLARDRNAKVAIECLISQNLVVIAGEVQSTATVAVEPLVRQQLAAIGYQDAASGIDPQRCTIVTNLHQQSADIQRGVAQQGAGDQGTLYGYATAESPTLLPIALTYAQQLMQRFDVQRRAGALPGFYPDAKTQVTVTLDDQHQLQAIPTIVLSAQHAAELDEATVHAQLIAQVLRPVMPTRYFTKTRLLINPTGRFVIGGPAADTGVTGRKLMVDTYGGLMPHGGGAFSGKDPTKVDRSGAYMARFVAKNIVAAGLAQRCLIALSYAIGVAQPVAIRVETFQTETVPLALLTKIVQQSFDFSVAGMIRQLHLTAPIYQSTATYGHFKAGYDYPWEATPLVATLQALVQ